MHPNFSSLVRVGWREDAASAPLPPFHDKAAGKWGIHTENPSLEELPSEISITKPFLFVFVSKIKSLQLVNYRKSLYHCNHSWKPIVKQLHFLLRWNNQSLSEKKTRRHNWECNSPRVQSHFDCSHKAAVHMQIWWCMSAWFTVYLL